MTPSNEAFNPRIIDTGSPLEVMNAYGAFCRQTYAPNPIPYLPPLEYPFDKEFSDGQLNTGEGLELYNSKMIDYDNHHNRLRDHHMLALHCVLGVVGEVAELDQLPETHKNPMPFTENVCEEMGDIVYYLCVYAKSRNLIWSPLELPENSPEVIASVNPMMGVDLVKRFVFYQNESYGLKLDKYFKTLGYGLIRGMLSQMPEANFRTVFRHNYNKLKTRYDKMMFTAEDAAARKDKVGNDDNPTT